MQVFKKILGWRVSSEVFDVGLGQVVCFAGGAAILVLGIFALTRLELPVMEALFGVILVSVLSLLLIVLGMLVGIAQAVKNIKSPRQAK